MAQADVSPPSELLTELAHLFTHGHFVSNIRLSCKHYHIPSEESSHIARARLMLHISGITSDYVGEDILERCVADVCLLTRQNVFEVLEYLNSQAKTRFPYAWVTCLARQEVFRQFFFRLLTDCKIPIPPSTQSTVFHGVEPPQKPTFELHGCFEHLMAAKSGRHDRWIYIDKALSAFGVYPSTYLFQSISDVLVDVFAQEVLSAKYKKSSWRHIRVLKALGMVREVEHRSDGTTVKLVLVQPWGLELESPYDLDFWTALWISTQVTTARAEGQRRIPVADMAPNSAQAPLSANEHLTPSDQGSPCPTGSLAYETLQPSPKPDTASAENTTYAPAPTAIPLERRLFSPRKPDSSEHATPR